MSLSSYVVLLQLNTSDWCPQTGQEEFTLWEVPNQGLDGIVRIAVGQFKPERNQGKFAVGAGSGANLEENVEGLKEVSILEGPISLTKAFGANLARKAVTYLLQTGDQTGSPFAVFFFVCAQEVSV